MVHSFTPSFVTSTLPSEKKKESISFWFSLVFYFICCISKMGERRARLIFKNTKQLPTKTKSSSRCNARNVNLVLNYLFLNSSLIRLERRLQENTKKKKGIEIKKSKCEIIPNVIVENSRNPILKSFWICKEKLSECVFYSTLHIANFHLSKAAIMQREITLTLGLYSVAAHSIFYF